MRNVIAAVMASTLALSAYSQAAEVVTSVNWLPGDEGAQRSSQSHMFDGISLTEHQRQQLRDLMQRARHDRPPLMLAKWRQCIALSPQKILMKTLCALRQKNGAGTGCPPG
jgi:protein CpxP